MEQDTSWSRLAQAREAKGFSQAEMAKRMGMSQQSYFYYEHGREMKAGMIVRACAILECSPGWLLGLEDTGKHLPKESPLMKALSLAFEQLNDTGQRKVIEYAGDLTGNVEYSVVTIEKEAQDAVPLDSSE